MTPDAVLAAARDFSPRRPELWPNIHPAVYAVHTIGDTWVEVTDGSADLGGTWARVRREWSTPGMIRAEVQASDVFKAAAAGSFRCERPAAADLRWNGFPGGIRAA